MLLYSSHWYLVAPGPWTMHKHLDDLVKFITNITGNSVTTASSWNKWWDSLLIMWSWVMKSHKALYWPLWYTDLYIGDLLDKTWKQYNGYFNTNMYMYDLPFLHSDWQSVKYILIVKDKLTTDRIVWQLSSRLEDGSRVWQKLQYITVFTSIPKGLIISSQSTSNWSLLPYRLHHVSHKSLGKTDQNYLLWSNTRVFMCQADSKCAKVCIFKCFKGALRNTID